MVADVSLLRSLRSQRDDILGLEERFEALELRSGRTVGLVGMPLGQRLPMGWLICHSFGAEHWHLSATDVAIARALSANGFPTLRFHSQGYGDSELTDFTPNVSTHLADAIDAAAELRSIAGVSEIGIVGSRFGGTIARLAAEDARASCVALVDPVISGRRYLRNLMRAKAIVELTGDHADPQLLNDEPASDLPGVIKDGGSVNVRGFVITPAVFEEMAKLDLLGETTPLEKVLLVQVSRGDSPSVTLTQLKEQLIRNGDDVRTSTISGPYAALFGDGHFRPTEGDELGDTLVEINREISTAIVDWAISNHVWTH